MKLNYHIRVFLLILVATLLPVILVWTPFFLRLESVWGIKLPQQGMATIISNFDGPYYIVVAKTFYDKNAISQFEFPLHREYYAAHFPGFPILIKAASLILGYPWAMMTVTIISSFFALWFFYLLLTEITTKQNALWLTLVFSIFPARWLIVRSIGSPEPLFLAAIIATYYFFLRKDYIFMGLAGSVAMLTKSPGSLLFVALVFAILAPNFRALVLRPFETIKKIIPQITPLFLIPISVLFIFLLFARQYNDFFAYFHSGDNIHLMFPPFQVFNTAQTWVGTFWLEEIIWIYLFAFLGIFQLIKKGFLHFASFVAIFFFSTLFASHRDIARYIMPIVPFLFIAFGEVLVSKPFRWAILLLTIPIYLYSLNFIIGNTTPIADWTPLL